jgi:hypothetical protein
MSHRLQRFASLYLVGLLLVAPAASASQEEAKEQAEPAKKTESPAAPSKPAAAPASATQAGAPDAKAKKPAPKTSPDKCAPAPVDPSFNTIEDVLAFAGPVDALWVDGTEPEAAVTWRPIRVEAPPPPADH